MKTDSIATMKKNEKKQFASPKKTTYKETYNFLRDDIEGISRGEPIFRAFSTRHVGNNDSFIKDAISGKITDFGDHWTTGIDRAKYIGKEKLFLDKPWYIIEAIVTPDCIDVKHSFYMRNEYPDEDELFLSECSNIKVTKFHDVESIKSR